VSLPATSCAARPKTDLAVAQRLIGDVGFLMQELRRLLDVVVLERRGVLGAAVRQEELESLLSVWAELVTSARQPTSASSSSCRDL
jgi:hypothetical protein